MNKYSVFPQKTVHDSSFDAALIASMVLLVGLGLVTLYITSADYAGRMFDNPLYFVKRQALGIAAGLLFLLIFAWIDMDMLRKALPFIVIGIFILCFFPFLPGIGIRQRCEPLDTRSRFFDLSAVGSGKACGRAVFGESVCKKIRPLG